MFKRIEIYVKRIIKRALKASLKDNFSSINDNIALLKSDIESLANVNEGLRKDNELLKSELSDLIQKYCRYDKDSRDYFYYLISRQKINAHFECSSEILKVLDINKKNKSKLKILLCGNYGDANVGDELMLHTIISRLTKYSNVSLTVMLAPNNGYDTLSLGENIDSFHWPLNIYDFQFIASHFDKLIIGGGALLEDRYYDSNYDYGVSIGRTVVDLSQRFIEEKKQVYCIGLSTGNSVLQNEKYIAKLNSVIENSSFFSLRDPYSLKLLKQSRVNCDKVVLSEDIVFANKELSLPYADFIHKSETNIGIIWICNDRTMPDLQNLLKKVRDYCDSNSIKDYCIHLIPFYEGITKDVDYYENYKDTNVIVEGFTTDLHKIIAFLRNNDLLISMRYHGSLLGLSLGLPVINILYNQHPHYPNKYRYLLEQFNYDLTKCIQLDELNKLSFNDLLDAYVIKGSTNSTYRLIGMADIDAQNLEKLIVGA